ncbi:hypothetical protein WJX64_08275 [Leifsonia sp. YIM 134122]|jgi:hypothetical protein|uniref:Methionine/alanine importer small subunit n=1 Tax=Leifsonia stereocauli TaxID=3134136 RepID=A0ABU9W3W2_9MICO|nr:hypothetical protein [Leifsonia flava]
MSIILLIALVALVFWGALATILGLDNDGYGRPEIRDRTRHAGHGDSWDARWE